MPDRALNATAASLLGFLHQGPMSGWDLAATAQTVIGDFWSLTRSQVYRELSAMAAAGLVEAGEPGPRERRAYTLTQRGREAFAEWIRQEPPSEIIRFPLLLTISLGRHLERDQLGHFIETHRAVHAQRLAGYEQQHAALTDLPGPDPHVLATLEFGLAYERAVLAWFNRLPELLGPAGLSQRS